MNWRLKEYRRVTRFLKILTFSNCMVDAHPSIAAPLNYYPYAKVRRSCRLALNHPFRKMKGQRLAAKLNKVLNFRANSSSSCPCKTLTHQLDHNLRMIWVGNLVTAPKKMAPDLAASIVKIRETFLGGGIFRTRAMMGQVQRPEHQCVSCGFQGITHSKSV